MESITVQASDLHKALTFLKPALKNVSRLPVLDNVAIETTPGGIGAIVQLRMTNLDVFMQTKVEGTGGTLATTIPYKALVGLVGKTGQVTIRQSAANRVQVQTDTGTTELPAIAITEYPTLPNWAKFPTVCTIQGATLARVAKEVTYAAKSDNGTGNPVLCGVLWRRTPAGSVFAGADGFRLAVLTGADGVGDGTDILPAPSVRAMGTLTGEVTLYRAPNGNQVAAVGTNGAVYSRCIDGKYPTYEVIIPPAETMMPVQIDGPALSTAVSALAALVKGKYSEGAMAVRAVGSRLVLAARNGGGVSRRIELPLLVPVLEERSQAMNPRYLLDAIGGHKGAVSVNLAPSPGAPFTFSKAADLFCLIMPMHLAQGGQGHGELMALLADPVVDVASAPVEEAPVVAQPAPEPETVAEPVEAAPPVKAPRKRARPGVPVANPVPDPMAEWMTDPLVAETVHLWRRGQLCGTLRDPLLAAKLDQAHEIIALLDLARRIISLPEWRDRCTQLADEQARGIASEAMAPLTVTVRTPQPEPAPVEAPADPFPPGTRVASRSLPLAGTVRRAASRNGVAGLWLTGGVWLALVDVLCVPEMPTIGPEIRPEMPPMAERRPALTAWAQQEHKPASKATDAPWPRPAWPLPHTHTAPRVGTVLPAILSKQGRWWQAWAKCWAIAGWGAEARQCWIAARVLFQAARIAAETAPPVALPVVVDGPPVAVNPPVVAAAVAAITGLRCEGCGAWAAREGYVAQPTADTQHRRLTAARLCPTCADPAFRPVAPRPMARRRR